MLRPVIIRELGLVDYANTYPAMRRFTDDRGPTTPDEIWLLEHPSVYTLGTNADEAHILRRGPIPVVSTDRGGQVTWHGPGQLVAYVLLDLNRARIGIRDLVCGLEQAVIATLAGYGITADGLAGAPGVYCGTAKIASIGLRIRRHCSYHGLSINVCNELQPFADINPCGYEGLEVTRTCDQNGPAAVAELATSLIPNLLAQLRLEVQPE
jgi:lipoyl(octanoyl) transferase